jgi:hypothetical protein
MGLTDYRHLPEFLTDNWQNILTDNWELMEKMMSQHFAVTDYWQLAIYRTDNWLKKCDTLVTRFYSSAYAKDKNRDLSYRVDGALQ